MAGIVGLCAVVLGVWLPLAPVQVNEPTVAWPRDAARPSSTLLPLTAYRPLGLDIRFDCDVARAAGTTAEGIVVATMVPGAAGAEATGLLVAVSAGRVQVRAAGRTLLDEPVPAGPCTYRITGASAGRPDFVASAPTPFTPLDPGVPRPPAPVPDGRFAGPGNAQLVVERDGLEQARVAAPQLPEVDALITSVVAAPTGGLAVTLRIDDEFSSAPTPLKIALGWGLVVALLGTATALAVLDRRRASRPDRRRFGPPRLVDAVVPATLLAWAFVAPATADDGWFATQARNAGISGDVGSYYNLYDYSYVPFTWLYHGLAWWQQVAGTAVLTQRLPAVVLGVLTWWAIRRVAAHAVGELWPHRGRAHRVAPVVLAVAFLAWWLPYDMGVRPESAVALCGAVALLAVLVAVRRGSLLAVWLACAVAGIGFAAHTTGVTMLAPLLAGLPALAAIVHVRGDVLATVCRAVAAASGGCTAFLAGFADGALRDFLRSRTLLESVGAQDGWADEAQRYLFLLDQIPMGNFAKRAAVLVALVVLVGFAVLAVAARVRRVAVPAALTLAASSTAISLILLALTPSKWTHHFGALAGVGGVFLGLALVSCVPLTRQVCGSARLPISAIVVAVVGSAVVSALIWNGPNAWPYAWLDGMAWAYTQIAPWGVRLDQPLVWIGATAVVAAVLVTVRRAGPPEERRWAAATAVPAIVVVSLLGTTVAAVAGFGVAAASGIPPSSVWARTLADPAGTACGAAGAVTVLDPFGAQPLPDAGLPGAPPAAEPAFVEGGGFYAGNRPQGAAAARLWGSLTNPRGGDANRTRGRLTTGWFALPPPSTESSPENSTVTVEAAGTLGSGNTLVAVYGTRTGDTVAPAGSEVLDDATAAASWRTLRLRPPPGADVVALDATDDTTAVHGWLAVTAPVLARPVVLQDLLGRDAPTALGWNVAFAYPCQRVPRIVDGITEPPRFAVLRGERPLDGLGDLDFQLGQGSAFGHVVRSQPVLQLATVGPVDPYLQVYAFASPFAVDDYTITRTQRTVGGADTRADHEVGRVHP